MLQCGLHQIIVTYTTPWQELTIGSHISVPERLGVSLLMTPRFMSCAMSVTSPHIILTVVSFLQCNFISPCFRQPFSEGSSHSVGGLTRPTRILDFVMRKTLLLRPGYQDGFTRI